MFWGVFHPLSYSSRKRFFFVTYFLMSFCQFHYKSFKHFSNALMTQSSALLFSCRLHADISCPTRSLQLAPLRSHFYHYPIIPIRFLVSSVPQLLEHHFNLEFPFDQFAVYCWCTNILFLLQHVTLSACLSSVNLLIGLISCLLPLSLVNHE